MKILYIQQHFSLPTEGGGGRGWEFARRFAEKGHQVTLVSGGPQSRRREVDGVSVITVQAPYNNRMSYARRLLAFAQFVAGSLRWAIAIKPDVVLASSTPLTVAIPALVAAARPRTRFVFEIRDLWPEVPVELGVLKNPALIAFAKGLAWLTYRRADTVVALSPYMAEGVRRVNPTVRVETIPNGCDIDMFDEDNHDPQVVRASLGVPADGKLIVYAGGFGYLYDLDWCLELAKRLDGENIFFTFVGDGSSFDRLVEEAKASAIYRPGMFTGKLPKSEVIGLLKASDAMVSTLRDHEALEGCSLNKVFDSMAAGRPLLFNHRGWLAEQVEAAGGGWWTSRNIEEAVRIVKAALGDGEEVEKRGSDNRALGEREYDRDQQFRHYESIISSLFPSAKE